MIKRYNQFSKTRLNEYFTMEETDAESTKSILPIDRSKNMMTPELDSSVEYGEEEEVGIDKYTDAIPLKLRLESTPNSLPKIVIGIVEITISFSYKSILDPLLKPSHFNVSSIKLTSVNSVS